METITKNSLMLILLAPTIMGWFFPLTSRNRKLTTGPYSDLDEACLRHAEKGNCEFYLCLEAKAKCGSEGYPTAYGYKYCRKFNETAGLFTEMGRDWINCVRPCITSQLADWFNNNRTGKRCNDLKKFAFDNIHEPCYKHCNLCSVVSDSPKNTTYALRWTYRVRKVFSEPMTRQALRQIFSTLTDCTDEIEHSFQKSFYDTFKEAMNSFWDRIFN